MDLVLLGYSLYGVVSVVQDVKSSADPSLSPTL